MACLCTGISYAELDQAVAANPHASVESLGETLGCGVQCGSCLPAIKEALGEVAWFPATASSTSITRSDDAPGLERLIYRVDIHLAERRLYPRVLPGQHIVLRADTGERMVERTYTVVTQDQEKGRLTLGVRRNPDGEMTPWLLDAPVGAERRQIEVSAPGGPVLGSNGRRPDVFFAAGVGVTPAAAMISVLASSATMHLHYSVRKAHDAAFLAEFERRRKHCALFSYKLRETSTRGKISESRVRSIVAEYPGAKFYVCGPAGYVDSVRRGLKRARVDSSRIHVELFSLSPARSAARTTRFKAYVAGALLALLPLLLLLPAQEGTRPHGHPNVGHEKLKCVSCHQETSASTRQTFQAKVKHSLGLRQTGAVMGMQAVTSATCIQCHANPDDRHATNRFLEPRFEKARAETGAQLCVSCHREHSAARVTAPTAGYCVSCHSDMKVKNEKITPTHDFLVRNKRWDACLQCHDYHGNHNKWSTPLRLQDAATLDRLDKYLQGGPSVYGATVVKATREPRR